MNKYLLLLCIAAVSSALPVTVDASMAGRRVAVAGKETHAERANGEIVSPCRIPTVGVNAPAPSDGEAVEETPAGTMTLIERTSVGLEALFGLLDFYPEPGLVVEKIEGDDGKIWFNNPFSRYPLQCYFYGVADDTTLTIPGGQPMGLGWDANGDIVPTYLVAVKFKDDDYGGWCYPGEDIDFRFRIEGDEYIAEDGNLCLGLCSWNQQTGQYEWLGYADRYVVYGPNTGRPVEVPAGESEKWALTLPDGSGYFVDVLTTGENIYVKGIYNSIPDAWVKLDIEDDAAVLYPGQYLGVDDNMHYAYACTGTVEEMWDEFWERYVDVVTPSEKMVFIYDSEKKMLDGKGCSVIIATSATPARVDTYISNPVIAFQKRVPGTPPANPCNLGYTAYDPAYGDGFFWFDLPCVDTDGNLLDVNHLFYRFYVDEEVYEFSQEDYCNLPEPEMTMIPWTLNLDGNFYAIGISHSLTYYFEGFDSLGVQSVYLDPENGGEETSSYVIVGVTNPGSVSATTNHGKEISRDYYDLQGRPLTAPASGIGIIRAVCEDGTVIFRKAIL